MCVGFDELSDGETICGLIGRDCGVLAHAGREFGIILIDTSKIFFLSIQCLGGIEWSYDICAISSAPQKSNTSDEQPSASM
jgi:hypothetical protein